MGDQSGRHRAPFRPVCGHENICDRAQSHGLGRLDLAIRRSLVSRAIDPGCDHEQQAHRLGDHERASLMHETVDCDICSTSIDSHWRLFAEHLHPLPTEAELKALEWQATKAINRVETQIDKLQRREPRHGWRPSWTKHQAKPV
jgi:hypothetical protein